MKETGEVLRVVFKSTLRHSIKHLMPRGNNSKTNLVAETSEVLRGNV